MEQQQYWSSYGDYNHGGPSDHQSISRHSSGDPTFDQLGMDPTHAQFGQTALAAENMGRPEHSADQPEASSSSGSGQAAVDSSALNPAALRRGMACAFCRRRKLRCSGGRPRCTSCVKYSQSPCEYAQNTFKQARIPSEGSGTSTPSAIPARISPPAPPLYRPPSVPQPRPEPRSNVANIPHSASYDSGLSNLPISGFHPNNYGTDQYLDFSTQYQAEPASMMSQDHIPPSAPQPQSSPYQPFSNHLAGWEPQTFLGAGPYMAMFENATTAPQPESNWNTDRPMPPHQPLQQFSYSTPATLETTEVAKINGETHIFQSSDVFARSAEPGPSQPANYRFTQMRTTANLSTPASIGSRQSGDANTPDDSTKGIMSPPLGSTVSPRERSNYSQPLPSACLINPSVAQVSHIDPIDGITESLGEFLISPSNTAQKQSETTEFSTNSVAGTKKRKGASTGGRAKDLIKVESDGMTDSARDLLLDCFLAHSRLFFEMSIPRFKRRMLFSDHRRPALALLYAMYLWATRMSNSPNMVSMESTFFDRAQFALNASSSNGERLIDTVRCAVLLSAYTYTSGRFHEAGSSLGSLLVSAGLHQIPSLTFRSNPSRTPFLRNKTFLLPPCEDAAELAERVSTFWCVCMIDRCSALATGFPPGLRDADITTPFPKSLADIATGAVTQEDDITIKDLWRHCYFQGDFDTPYCKWLKAVVVLERTSKLAFLDPDENSEHARAWSAYLLALPQNPNAAVPPPWLDQPKYRCPREYAEIKFGLEQMINNMGEDGINPVDRRRNAHIDGAEEPWVSNHTISVHHQFAASQALLHDINSLDCENSAALIAARRSIALIKEMPEVPHTDVDSFLITVWSILARIFAKELRRLTIIGDPIGAAIVEEEVDVYISECERVGAVMHLARAQAKSISDLKKQALDRTSVMR